MPEQGKFFILYIQLLTIGIFHGDNDLTAFDGEFAGLLAVRFGGWKVEAIEIIAVSPTDQDAADSM
jgi:hypothetical protein